jgi:hypothetical protein
MICAISQPTYLPWLGQFNLMDHVDVFVFYDDVQVVRQSWATRNQIKTSQGPLWLPVPILHNKHFDEMLFNNTLIDEKKNWKKKQLKSIQNAYSKATCFKEVIQWLEDSFSNSITTLGDLNVFLIEDIAKKIGITTKFLRSANLNSKEGKKDDRLVSICKELGAKIYLSPVGSYNYIEANQKSGAFLNSGVELLYQQYEHPVYPQIHGDFVNFMCILDLLFNVGFDNALEVIKSGRRPPFSSMEIRKKYMHE